MCSCQGAEGFHPLSTSTLLFQTQVSIMKACKEKVKPQIGLAARKFVEENYSLEDNFLEIKTENISLVKKSLKNYQRIKDDRNNINHANRKNLSSVEELGKFIKDSIQQIKNI